MISSFKPQFVVIPGDTLKETIDELGMNQSELALRCGLSPKTITEIANGDSAITTETALKFENALGIDASFWLNLEQNYQKNLARIEAEKSLDQQITIAKKFTCYDDLAKHNLVEDTTEPKRIVEQLLSFFGVNTLDTIYKTQKPAFRISTTKNISEECLAAWLRWGEKEATKTVLNARLEKKKLKDTIELLRKYTFKDPRDCEEELKEFFASNGIIFAYLPYLEKTYVNGATRWIGDKALIQISPRNKYKDIFWFTLFHEVGHIVLHGKKDEFIEIEDKIDENSKRFEQEKDADAFASETLIPNKAYKSLIKRNYISDRDIISFSNQIGVSSDIIAGRLAYEGRIKWNRASHLRTKLATI